MSVTFEREGFNIALSSNADGTYSFEIHNISGGAGVADQGLEVQGYRMQLHDNGDGTFSVCTTTSTGPNDTTIEFEGFLIKIHPTGESDPVTGEPMYAFVTTSV